jgi:Ca2+/H+ antiporter, TMEM165/GDT1 family
MNGPLFAIAIVFAVVGGTELVDRTNFALISLAARQAPLPSWAGAALAFLCTSTLAVLIGAALVTALAPDLIYVRIGGGVFLIAYALYLGFAPDESRRIPSARSALASAFLLIFLLELGDTTMILTILFVSDFAPVLVFIGAASALITVAALGCLIGSRLGAKVEPRVLDRIVVVVLILVGLVTILIAVEPGWFNGLV